AGLVVRNTKRRHIRLTLYRPQLSEHPRLFQQWLARRISILNDSVLSASGLRPAGSYPKRRLTQPACPLPPASGWNGGTVSHRRVHLFGPATSALVWRRDRRHDR